MTDSRWSRLRDRVDWRVRATAVAWFVVGVGMVLSGMEPHLVLLGFVVMIAAAVMWLIIDLAPVSSPLVWVDPASLGRPQDGHDLRVRILRSRMKRSPARRRPHRGAAKGEPEPPDQVIEALLGVVDHHLLAEHGIDRAADPTSAASVLGPDLGRFVTDADAQRAMTRRRSLAGTIELIEDLTLTPPSTTVE